MDNAFFAMVSRMKYINRWSLMRNTLSENLSEHSLQVAVIAHALALIRNEYFPLGSEGEERLFISPEKAGIYAIFHDANEILTGDMPTPVKYMNQTIEKVYKEVEKNAAERMLNMLPDRLKDSYASILIPDRTDPQIKEIMAIVKAADKISALIKCIEEEKAGNTEFISAAKNLEKSILDNPLPEVKHFMENFLTPFSLTLDELENGEVK